MAAVKDSRVPDLPQCWLEDHLCRYCYAHNLQNDCIVTVTLSQAVHVSFLPLMALVWLSLVLALNIFNSCHELATRRVGVECVQLCSFLNGNEAVSRWDGRPASDRSTVLWSYLYMEVSGWQWRPEKVAQGVYCHQGPPLMLAKNYRNHFSLFKKRDRFVTAL